MQLTGKQRKQLQQALVSAFPTHGKLVQMVSFQLDANLDTIAGGQNYLEVVFNLIAWAEAEGRLEDLVTAARFQNSGNSSLRECAEQLGFSQPVVELATSPKTDAPLQGNAALQTPTDSNLQRVNQASAATAPIEIFFSYSHKDEELRDELANHLSMMKRQGVIAAWHDREITAGSNWAGVIDAHLNSAQVVLLLISSNFLASDYCYDIELGQAMERYKAGEAIVIPIILKPCDWTTAPFGKLQALPKNALPVTKWVDRDEAFLNVAQGIRAAIKKFRAW